MYNGLTWAGVVIVCIHNIQPTTPLILQAIGMSGVFGVSMIISLSSDLLAFMTLHVYWFYMVAARIFNWQFTILYSLFNLFRGKAVLGFPVGCYWAYPDCVSYRQEAECTEAPNRLLRL